MKLGKIVIVTIPDFQQEEYSDSPFRSPLTELVQKMVAGFHWQQA